MEWLESQVGTRKKEMNGFKHEVSLQERQELLTVLTTT